MTTNENGQTDTNNDGALAPLGSYKTRAKKGAWAFNYSGKEGSADRKIKLDVPFVIMHPTTKAQVTVNKSLYFTEGAKESSIRQLRILGWTGSSLKELANGGGNLDANEVEVTLVHKPYVDKSGNAKVFTEVDWINAVGDGPRAAPVALGDLDSLSAKMESFAKGVTADSGRGKKKAINGSDAPDFGGAAPAPTDEELPF